MIPGLIIKKIRYYFNFINLIEKCDSYYDLKNQLHLEVNCEIGKFCCGPCEARSCCFDYYQKLWKQDICKQILENKQISQTSNYISEK